MPFTPLPSLVGGLLLSYSTSVLLVSQGRVLGCSGVAHSSISSLFSRLNTSRRPPRHVKGDSKELGPAPPRTDGWKLAALAGLISGGTLLRFLRPVLENWVGASLFDPSWGLSGAGMVRVALAGVLVGAGTKLANGCTSGHMLLGLARLSTRSLAAVLTFFTAALVTARVFPLANVRLVATSSTAFSTPSSALSPSTAALLILLPFLFSFPSLAYSPPIKSLHPSLPSLLQSFTSSILFSLGLALAGMTRPSKVLSFFYVPLPLPGLEAPAAWDPSLAMVAVGGLLPNAVVWQAVKGWKSPLRREKWDVPRGGKVDGRLILGAALFGVGWGLVGICPGPLFAVLGAGPSISGPSIPLFAATFAVGGWAAGRAFL
ncbi:hypothetical protein JCM8097_000475 [Rhodosporidiobolus ruineniae]